MNPKFYSLQMLLFQWRDERARGIYEAIRIISLAGALAIEENQ